MQVFLVDDDPLMLQAIGGLLLSRSYQVITANRYAEALDLMGKIEPDFAVFDIQLGDPKYTGLDLLSAFKQRFPDKPVLMASGLKDIPTVIECMKRGAEDYIEKPFDKNSFNLKLEKLLSTEERVRVYKRIYQKTQSAYALIGKDPVFLQAKQTVQEAGSLRILFTGETGVGKTPFARYSNQVVSEIERSPRPFEQVNCSCLSVESLQDQLFGHCKGAFTGAISDKKGLVQLAENGDLFLDEVGDMPLQAQANLLTFLDTMEYYRLGEDRKRHAKVRILAASNRDLKKMVQEGNFRKDLYSRLAQVEVVIPPLRNRMSDLPLLMEYFIRESCGYQKPYAPEILELLSGYHWEEGNVRELRSAVEYICQRGRSAEGLALEHVGNRYRTEGQLNTTEVDGMLNEELFALGLENYLDQIEARVLRGCIDRFPMGLEVLSERLKTSKATLYRRLKKYELLN